MLTDLKVKVGPQFYRYHEGALASVPSLSRNITPNEFWWCMAPYPLKSSAIFTILGRFRVSILLSHLHRRM